MKRYGLEDEQRRLERQAQSSISHYDCKKNIYLVSGAGTALTSMVLSPLAYTMVDTVHIPESHVVFYAAAPLGVSLGLAFLSGYLLSKACKQRDNRNQFIQGQVDLIQRNLDHFVQAEYEITQADKE